MSHSNKYVRHPQARVARSEDGGRCDYFDYSDYREGGYMPSQGLPPHLDGDWALLSDGDDTQ